MPDIIQNNSGNRRNGGTNGNGGTNWNSNIISNVIGMIENYYNESDTGSESGSSNESWSDQKFKFVLCEIHNPSVHGFDENSDINVAGHYLVHSKYDYILPPELLAGCDSDGEYWSEQWFEETPSIHEVIDEYKHHLVYDILPNVSYSSHPFIRNYKTIISNENYIKPEIAECIYLSGGECVAILKTFWLRIVQRKWKNVFKERNLVTQWRANPISLRYREIYGFWPSYCFDLPGLRGMLSPLA